MITLTTPQERHKLFLFVAFMALAFNLRSHLTSIPSVITTMQEDMGISGGTAGLLTSIPVLCFALLTPVASFVISKMSLNKAVLFTLTGVVAGVAIRSLGPIETAFAGTFIMGFALTIGNIVCLLIIARDFPKQRNMVTGLYVSAMSVSSMLTSAATAPISRISGWQIAIGIWGLLGVAAIVLWLMVIRSSKKFSVSCETGTPQDTDGTTECTESSAPTVPVWKRPKVYLLSLAFACHASLFYGLTAWLPKYLAYAVNMTLTDAGLSASIFQIAGLIGCLGVPALSSIPFVNRTVQFWIVSCSWFVMPLGLLLMPKLWLIWSVIGGIGAGGGFTVVFGLVMDQAVSFEDNRHISSFVQGIGYTFAALCPALIGAIYSHFNSWVPGFLLLIILAVTMITCGTLAAQHQAEQSA